MLLIRHNLDVMHIEKNVFDNIFNTVMDIKEKTKDNINASRDLKIICNRPELELDKRRPNVMPKVVYTLENEQKRRVCEWIRALKFLDGYASNLARGTHAMQVDVPIERFLRELKKKVKNKAFVEASIVEAYIVEEIGMCTSQYFESFVQSKRSMPRRNDECTSNNDGFQRLCPSPRRFLPLRHSGVSCGGGHQLTSPGPWDAPAPLLPPQAQRHYISLQDARALFASLGQHIADPTGASAILVPEAEGWDCDDESMFKLVKLQAGKFLRNQFANARNQLARLLQLAEEIWRQLLQPDGGVRESVQEEERRPVERSEGEGGRGVLEAIEGTPGRREQQRGTDTSSQASVTAYEQQLWMLAASGRKRGRVIDLRSEAHHTIVGPS
ncbi:UNVERIFIED_CONTAM: hypothetical protein Sangu_2158000 [Sesamum angustifolium]|uniref:DUF4218 domain-containing protein n=1 Tax=Sesamum angustifolium TaxID=2727405 RepID=A0AAW2LFU1_9LAMI